MDKRNPLLIEIGQRIRQQRKKIGRTQEDIADDLGIDRAYYGKIELGMINVSILKLHNICQILKMNLSDLFPKELDK